MDVKIWKSQNKLKAEGDKTEIFLIKSKVIRQL